MELSAAASVGWALLITVVLAGLHLGAPRIRRLPFVSEGSIGSFAGGLSVAYVFLHLLPGMSIGSVLSRSVRPTPLVGLAGFLVALAGFTAFFGLERLADRYGDPPVEKGSVDPAVLASTGSSVVVYRLHLGSFMVYNALITCTMAARLRTGVDFAVLFSVVMGLHFVLTDRGLEEHYPRRFRGAGRGALAVALMAGWALSAVFALSDALLVALLTALLGGSILLNVFKEVLPSGRQSSFAWFLVGLVLYAALLSVVTAVNE